jgi:hypothetical protein
MPHSINVRLAVTVDRGPRVTATRTVELDAYDTVDVPIPADGNPHVVEVQPDDGEQVRLLVLTASSYDPPLTWDADEAGTERQLDQPLVLAGQALTSLVGGPANSIAFTNPGDADQTVQILVGRQAVDGA